MKQYYGYIRVSTVKQGQQGVSLQEQKDAILRYAKRSDIQITDWFEEQETAAKQGRPVFTQMIKLLQARKAQGVVLHKIDRGARNLRDWASIAELNDKGIDVHLANDGLDMKTRGGRLSADIQAVIAADFIRNLREETLKGFYGRLKQGILPIRAPLGYVDNGGGKVKTPDPVKAPLIKKAFELYASGKYSFDTLVPILNQLGLTSLNGTPLERTALTKIFNNPFYSGLIYIKTTREMFKGAHTPIITKVLFDRVHAILHGKIRPKDTKHAFLFRRLLRCHECQHALIGEKQKGHHYYRCQNKACPMKCIREEVVNAEIAEKCSKMTIRPHEARKLKAMAQEMRGTLKVNVADQEAALRLKLGQIQTKLERFADFLAEGHIDPDTFNTKKNAWLQEQRKIEEELESLTAKAQSLPDRADVFLEFLTDLDLQYRKGIDAEKRRILDLFVSNLSAFQEKVYCSMYSHYNEVAEKLPVASCAQQRDVHRMWEVIIKAVELPDDQSRSDGNNYKAQAGEILPANNHPKV